MVPRPRRGRPPFRFADCRSCLEGAGRADSWVLNNPNGLTVDVGVALLAASTAAPREPDLDLCPKPDELPSDRDRHCREPPPRHWLLRSIFPSQFWAEIMPLLAILPTA